MNKNLNQHVKSDKAKWAITSVVIVLILVTVVGMCLQLFGQGKVKPSEWFTKQPAENGEIVEVENTDTLRVHTVAPTMFSDSFAVTSSARTTAEDTRYITAENFTDEMLLNAFYGGDYEENAEYVLSISGAEDSFLPCIISFNNLFFAVGCTSSNEYDYNGEMNVVYQPNGILKPATYEETFDIFEMPFEENPTLEIRYSTNEVQVNFGGQNLSELSEYGDYEGLCEALLDNFTGQNKIVLATSLGEFEGMIVEEKVVYDNSDVQPLPPAPTKEGYTFTGWYLDEACTQKYNGTTITSDMKLYAGFKINTYTVTFNSDGGSSVASQKVNWNTAATLSTPTKKGYKFVGWFLANGTQYKNQPIKEDTTLKAKWEINSYTVTFNTDGGNNIAPKAVEYNKSVQTPTPTKEGYNFLGWFMESGKEYTGQAVTSDMTLKAKWEIKKLSVVFNTEGGNAIADKTVNYGQPVTLETPVKEGYNFLGWFLANNTQYTNQAIKANTTLTAKWEIKRFTVTFYVDGAVYNEMTVDYGTRLKDVADRAEVFAQNVVSYRFLSSDLPVGEFGEMLVVDDMEVEANPPTESDKVVGTIKNNWLPIVLGGVGLILLVVVISMVATRKRKRR